MDDILDENFDKLNDKEQEHFTKEYKIKTVSSVADWLEDEEEGLKLFDEMQRYYKSLGDI